MMEEQYIGKTYIQLTRKLEVQRTGGKPIESARPIDAKTKAYADLEAPTLITFDKDCQVDVGMLLRSGAIAEYETPADADAAPFMRVKEARHE